MSGLGRIMMKKIALRVRLWPSGVMFASASPSYGSYYGVPVGPLSVPLEYHPQGVMVATVVQHGSGARLMQPFVPTNLSIPSEYDHAGHSELITVRRRDLERCIRTTIEETIRMGGQITALARACMEALDKEAVEVDEETADSDGADCRNDVVYI
jgi:hypothetical protein